MKKTYEHKSIYYNNFYEFLTDISFKFKTQTALTFYDRKGTCFEITYEQLCKDSLKFAKALQSKGYVEKNIAIISENSYEWIIAYMGAAASGNVAICIDIENTDLIIQEMLEETDCVLIFAKNTIIDALYENMYFEKYQTEVISPHIKSEYNSIYEYCNDAMPIFQPKISPHQTASIVFTSGTTSTAKPVMLSQKGILNNAAAALKIINMGEKTFNSLPLYHSYGFTSGLLCGLISGSNICIICDLKRLLRDIGLFKPTLLIAVPLIVESIEQQMSKILNTAEVSEKIKKPVRRFNIIKIFDKDTIGIYAEYFKETDFDSIETIISGGAHLSADIAYKMSEYGITVVQGYGITECSPMISCNYIDKNKFGSVGEIIEGCSIKFVDNEIFVKSKYIMNGYYKDPKHTNEVFEGEWFKTGDLGYLDKKGRLYLTGRKKNLIVMKNGKKISAEELENELLKIPMIKNVIVHGALSGSSTDDVKIAAAVYPDPIITENMNNYEILDALQTEIDIINEKLPTYQQIQMINIRQNDFDRTSAKKIKRQMI